MRKTIRGGLRCKKIGNNVETGEEMENHFEQRVDSAFIVFVQQLYVYFSTEEIQQFLVFSRGIFPFVLNCPFVVVSSFIFTCILHKRLDIYIYINFNTFWEKEKKRKEISSSKSWKWRLMHYSYLVSFNLFFSWRGCVLFQNLWCFLKDSIEVGRYLNLNV